MQYACVIQLSFHFSFQTNTCTEREKKSPNNKPTKKKKEKNHREIRKAYIGWGIIFIFSNTGLEIQIEGFAGYQDPLCRLFFKWLYHWVCPWKLLFLRIQCLKYVGQFVIHRKKHHIPKLSKLFKGLCNHWNTWKPQKSLLVSSYYYSKWVLFQIYRLGNKPKRLLEDIFNVRGRIRYSN